MAKQRRVDDSLLVFDSIVKIGFGTGVTVEALSSVFAVPFFCELA